MDLVLVYLSYSIKKVEGNMLNWENEGAKVAGSMSRQWRVRSLGTNVKRMMLLGCEVWMSEKYI